MDYTDKQLREALSKMLPKKTVQLVPYGREDNLILCWDLDGESEPVRNTELLHLCWLVEEGLKEEEQSAYIHKIYQMQSLKNKAKWKIHYDCHATWKQRVKALAKVKGIEI